MTTQEIGNESDRALVVDDDPDIRKALEKSLRRLGYDVTTAENGTNGLKLALELPPKVTSATSACRKWMGTHFCVDCARTDSIQRW